MVNARSRSPPQSDHARNFSTIHAAQPCRRVLEPVAEGLRLACPGSPGSRRRCGATRSGPRRDRPARFGVSARTVLRRRGTVTKLRCSPTTRSGVEVGDVRRDDRAPVAALRAVAVVAELGHELDEGLRDAPRVPAALACRPGERRSRAATARRRGRRPPRRRRAPRVGERADDVEELDDRARPPVHEQQRQRVGFG